MNNAGANDLIEKNAIEFENGFSIIGAALLSQFFVS